MRPLRRKTFWRSVGRRLLAGLTLAAYLATAVGFPLPADEMVKDGLEPTLQDLANRLLPDDFR